MEYEKILEIDNEEDFLIALNSRIENFEAIFDLLSEMISWEELNNTISVSDSEEGSTAMIKRLFVNKSKTFEIISFMRNLKKITNHDSLKEAVLAKVAMDRVYLGK